MVAVSLRLFALCLFVLANILQAPAASITKNQPASGKGNPISALRARADLMVSAGKYSEAEKLYQEALKSDPSSADLHHQYGKLLSMMGKDKESLVYFEKALQSKRKDAELLSDIGVALVAAGDLPESIRHFEMALQCNPLYIPAYVNLGDALFRQGMYDSAITALRRSLDFQPGNLAVEQRLQEALAAAAAARSQNKLPVPATGIGNATQPVTEGVPGTGPPAGNLEKSAIDSPDSSTTESKNVIQKSPDKSTDDEDGPDASIDAEKNTVTDQHPLPAENKALPEADNNTAARPGSDSATEGPDESSEDTEPQTPK